MSIQSRLASHYDRKYGKAVVPDGKTDGSSALRRNRTEMTIYWATRLSGGRYLEIGAGSGETVFALVDHYEELIGTELSEIRTKSMNERLDELKLGKKVRIIRNNIETDALPFPEKFFNTIVINSVIEHLIDPIHVLTYAYKLLEVGGKLIINTPNIAKWTRRIKLAFGYFPSTGSLDEGLLCYDKSSPTDLHDEGHLHYFTYRSLVRLCKERAGFNSVEKYGYGNTFLSRFWPEMFSTDIFIIAYK